MIITQNTFQNITFVLIRKQKIMAEIFTIGNLFTLLMLILLQAVLGFDNLLYISLESKKAPEKYQKRVRKVGILVAIILRIGLLFILVSLIGFSCALMLKENTPINRSVNNFFMKRNLK